MAAILGQKEIPSSSPPTQIYHLQLLSQQQQQLQRFRLQLQQQNPVLDPLSSAVEEGFSKVGPGCDLDEISQNAHGHLQDLTPNDYAGLLPIVLEIGFRLVVPNYDQPALHLDHTPYHNWVFETAFSSYNDEVIADAVSVWIASGDYTPSGSCVHYFSKRVERGAPFSPRLRQVSIYAIEHTWHSELQVSALETIHLLNHLNIDMGEVEKEGAWARLLVGVICLPMGLESLSSHYWCLLDKLALARHHMDFVSHHMDSTSCSMVTRSLEKTEDWEKLEVWIPIVWRSAQWFEATEEVEQVTLKLLLRQPLALPRFKDICESGMLWPGQRAKLRQICNQAQTEQLLLGSLPLYVLFPPIWHLFILILSYFYTSVNQFTPSHLFLFILWEMIPSKIFCNIQHVLRYLKDYNLCFLLLWNSNL